jgi:beta-lactamase superfamily II metal-dependent hydrolase
LKRIQSNHDTLLCSEEIRFSIDEIFFEGYQKEYEKDVFCVRIIPDIDSKYFPPFHLRNFRVTADLLDRDFFNAHMAKFAERVDPKHDQFAALIRQGGYYCFERGVLKPDIFKKPSVVTDVEIPVLEKGLKNPLDRFKAVVGREQVEDINEVTGTRCQRVISDNLYVYCFNVGQGDSLLILTPAGNAYLIDVNIYSNDCLELFINNVQEILRSHNLSPSAIKAFIITHKHLDHIRGADQLLSNGRLSFEYFLINQGYPHYTLAVDRLLAAARDNIPKWVDIKSPTQFIDGEVVFSITNPQHDIAPDINDSSIVACIKYRDNMVYLTGDAGHSILSEQMIVPSTNSHSLLKVSHHGSRTGTNQGVVDLVMPTHAFISAGESANFKHPHNEALICLKGAETKVSKKVKQTVKYIVTGSSIFSSIGDQWVQTTF